MESTASSSPDRLRLRPKPPFDFDQSLAFVDGFTPCAGDRHRRDGALVTGGVVGDAPFVATVRPTRSESDAGDCEGATPLSVTVQWPTKRGDPGAVADQLRAFLSLDDDLRPLYRRAADDPPFERVVSALHGYHHVRFSTPFEAACWAALSQRTPWSLARRQKRALVEVAGHLANSEGGTVACFPTPRQVLDETAAIEGAIDHDRKVNTILEAARVFEATDLWALSDDALRERLGEIWGFGPWSSEFVALRGFGRLSGLPRTEGRLRAAVGDLYGLDGDATDAALDRLSEPYGSHRGYWAHYIRVWAEG